MNEGLPRAANDNKIEQSYEGVIVDKGVLHALEDFLREVAQHEPIRLADNLPGSSSFSVNPEDLTSEQAIAILNKSNESLWREEPRFFHKLLDRIKQ